MESFTIRIAKQDDCVGLKKLIQELAEFEKMPNEAKLTPEDLARDGFGDLPLFRCFVAEKDTQIIGMALFYTTYNTLIGKCMYLEDLCVTSKYRNVGVGSKLFDSVVKVAVDEDCARMDFEVLSWNPASRFYHTKGAIDCTETKHLHRMRMSRNEMISTLSTD